MRKKSKSTFGSIEKRGHNKYRIKWTDLDGVRRSMKVDGTLHKAEDTLAQIRLGMYAGRNDMTYDMYWKKTVRPSMDNLQPVTVHDYEKTWKRLRTNIGSLYIADTDWKVAQSVIDGYESQSAQRKAKVLWKKIMNMAVRDRIIASNPIDASIKTKQRVRRKKQMLYADDILPWMWCIEGSKYEPALLCLIGGGLRVEEALALRWEDIEPITWRGVEYAALSVSKAIVMVNNKAHEKDVPKNGSSNRVAIVGNPFARRLLELSDGKSGCICDNGSGKPSSPLTVTHNWKRWCENNGIVYVSLKDMRSSYATNLGEAMAPDSVVSKQMGHSDGTTKGENYQQSTIRGLMRIADMYEEIVEEPWQ